MASRPRPWHRVGRRNAVFMSSHPPHDHAAASPRAAAPLAAANRWGACCSAVRRVVSRAVRRLARHFTGLILPHIEQWRPADRGARQPALGAAGADRRHRGAFERLGAGARAARRAGPRRRAAASRCSLPRVAASLSPRSLLALEPRFEQLLIDGARRSRCAATPPATSSSPGSTSAARTRGPTTAATPPTGSSSSTSS